MSYIGGGYVMVKINKLFDFIVILKSFEIENNSFNMLNKIHSEIECLDVDLLVGYIEKSDVEMQLKEKLVSLINMYYDLIDNQINGYEHDKAEKYLSKLKETALTIFENNYMSLVKLCGNKYEI